MQSESKKYEEETPSLHWGMDPVFSAFARLYIKDIKEMRESKQVPGVFFYNGHPIRQVDVVGTVVQMKERDAFYNYGGSLSVTLDATNSHKLECPEAAVKCHLPCFLLPLLARMNGLAWYMKASTPTKIVAFCIYQGEEIPPARSLSMLWYKIKAAEMVTVDDSTGVINCVCWKNPMVAETSLSVFTGHPSTPSSLTVLEQMKKLQEMVRQKTKLEIGDVVRVRGHIRTYRQQREIQASCFYKVDDPVCDVQISRMLELPCLYREVYDKPFLGPKEGQSGLEGQNFTVNMLHEKVKCFLLENRIQTFYQQELETIDFLVSLSGVHVPSPSCQEVKSKSDSSSKRIHSVFKEAIRTLQEKGVVFQKPSSSKDLYYVTDHDKELLKVTLDVIKEDCRKPRHAEKGCHFLHVLSCVRQSYNPSLAEVVMHRVMELLESNSDVVSTMEGYYMAF